MARGDVIELQDGQRVLDTGEGYQPLEAQNPAAAAWVGVGSIGDRLLQSGQQLVGAITPEEGAAREADRETMRLAMGETNPVSNLVGRNIDVIPGMLPAGRAAAMGLGAVEGAMQPADTMTQRVANAALGGGFAGAGDIVGQGLGNMAGRVMAAVGVAGREAMPGVMRAAGEGAAAAGGNPVAQAAQEFGLEMTPGMASGSKLLQRYELGLARNPLTSQAFDRISQANDEVVTRVMSEAAGVPADVLGAGGGKITPGVLANQQAALGDQFEMLGNALPGEIKLPDGLQKALLANTDVKKLVKGGELFQGLEAGTITGQEYAKLRSALMKQAATESNGDVAQMLAGQAERLDKVIDNAVAGNEELAGLAQNFPRLREQYRNLQILQMPGVLRTDGTVNAGMMNARLRGNYGSTYMQEAFDQVQPETQSAIRLAKLMQDPAMRPIAGSSGTAEGLMANQALGDMASAVQGDTGAIARLMGMGRVGEGYMALGRENPKVLEAIMASPGNLFGDLDRAAARSAAKEQGRDE